MDPWMEQQWGDAHHTLITFAREQIRPLLPADLRARVEERVFVETSFGPERTIFPDLRVIERTRASTEPSSASTATLASSAGPILVELDDEPMTQGYIQIIDARSGNRVVTVIEVLSPANKRPGQGQEMFLRKQGECRQAKINRVEIDLLRGGQRVLSVPEERVPVFCRTPYRVCVRRGWRPSIAECYPVPLRAALPRIFIPLRQSDPDVPLELQPLVDQAYVSGEYDDTDYRLDPVPPLDPADAQWADAMLRGKGLR